MRDEHQVSNMEDSKTIHVYEDLAEDFPHASGISDFWPRPWASWITVLYEDLINKHYHELHKLKDFEHVNYWELSDD